MLLFWCLSAAPHLCRSCSRVIYCLLPSRGQPQAGRPSLPQAVFLWTITSRIPILTEARTLLGMNACHRYYSIIALMLRSKILTLHRNTPNLGARSRVCMVLNSPAASQRLEIWTSHLPLCSSAGKLHENKQCQEQENVTSKEPVKNVSLTPAGGQ